MTRIEELEAERARLMQLMKQQQQERFIAWGRDETDVCERGTVGCSVQHSVDPDDSCETW